MSSMLAIIPAHCVSIGILRKSDLSKPLFSPYIIAEAGVNHERQMESVQSSLNNLKVR
jgi:hypothetical protein